MMGRTLKVANESDIDELEEWVANTKMEVENTLNELELFNAGQRDNAPD